MVTKDDNCYTKTLEWSIAVKEFQESREYFLNQFKELLMESYKKISDVLAKDFCVYSLMRLKFLLFYLSLEENQELLKNLFKEK